MKKISRSAIVEHSAAQIYALVEDIEAYPKFLPWCREARVHERASSATRATPPNSVGGLRDAVVRSGLLERHPEIDLAAQKLGVFGVPAAPDRPLADGDRVEIYRALVMDPKEARRRRALGNARRKR